METQSLYRFVQEFLFHSASHFLSKVQCTALEPRISVSGVGLGPRRDRGTQCIVQTVDIETETDHKPTNRFSLITFPHHATKLPKCVGRGGGIPLQQTWLELQRGLGTLLVDSG